MVMQNQLKQLLNDYLNSRWSTVNTNYAILVKYDSPYTNLIVVSNYSSSKCLLMF